MPEAFLAIEASQRDASVALRAAPGASAREWHVPAPDASRDHLMAVIDEACRAAGVGPRDLRAIAVSCGPGGFTGLRVSCATAKAIADATGCALVAVPSALVVARTRARSGGLCEGPCAVQLAQKAGSAWVSEILVEDGWPRLVSAGLRDAPAGDGPEGPWSALACLELGEAMLARGESVDPLHLLPIYPRPAEAVTLWEARHGAKGR
jgi:tRNA threonylcarbamoyladenosine biosynthesis protein TsaB